MSSERVYTACGSCGLDGGCFRWPQRWVGWYRKGGVENVLSHKMGGKGQEPFLTDEAQEQVATEVGTGRFRTVGEIREWIAEEYGVTYTEGGAYSLMRRLGCSGCHPVLSMPRPIRSNKPPGKKGAWAGAGTGRGDTPNTPGLRR